MQTKSKPGISRRAAAVVRGRAGADRRELSGNKGQRPMMAHLYRRAEAQMRKLSKARKLSASQVESGAEPMRLLQELQVQRIELEIQNSDLRLARDELETALENYTDLYDFAPVGYFTLTGDSSIRQANLTGASLMGVERSRLVGRRFDQWLEPGCRPAFGAFLKQVFAGKQKLSGDFELIPQGRPPRTVNIETRRLLNASECRAAVVDITERKLAEDKLRVSEVRYRRLFEAAHDGVLILNPVTRKITDSNPFMTRLLGYSHEQLVGRELFEIGLLKDEEASQEMFRKLKRMHEVRYEDMPLAHKDGRHQEVEVVANLYCENGQSVIQCNIRDITDRKHAEGISRRNEALFSTLIEQAPVGVYVVDSGFRMQQINRKARPAFAGVRPLLGRDFSEVIHALWQGKAAERIEKRFRHTLKTGRPYQESEFSAQRRDIDEKEIYEWQIQRVTLPAGGQGVVCFFSNITNRKRDEEALRRVAVLAASNQKLEREVVRRRAVELALKTSERIQVNLLKQSIHQQELLRQLSRQVLRVQEDERKAISRELHDVIAQTLTDINVRLGSLKKEATLSTRDLDRKIALTQRMVEKSVDIVHQFARELRPTLLDDLGLIPALHSYMKSFTTRTGVRVRLAAFKGVELLDGNQRTVLYRVAQEALTNVARHAQASRVDVEIKRLPRGISMSIHDDGKSFRVKSTLTANRGQRLGLLGMRERVEMIGGTFTVESAPGRGTSVCAEIPFAKSRTRRAAALTNPLKAELESI